MNYSINMHETFRANMWRIWAKHVKFSKISNDRRRTISSRDSAREIARPLLASFVVLAQESDQYWRDVLTDINSHG